MSVQAVAWVLDDSRSRGFARLVAIALANHADKTTGECYPSQRTIAAEAGIATGSVPNQIRVLVALGELEVIEDGGPRRSARYRLTFCSGAEHKCAQELSAARGPGLSAARGPGLSRTISNRHEPSEGAPQASPTPRGSRIPETFDVTPTMVAWALAETPDVDWRLATKTFVAHWKAESGSRAVKLDWAAAWRKWLLKDQASARRGRAVRTHL